MICHLHKCIGPQPSQMNFTCDAFAWTLWNVVSGPEPEWAQRLLGICGSREARMLTTWSKSQMRWRSSSPCGSERPWPWQSYVWTATPLCAQVLNTSGMPCLPLYSPDHHHLLVSRNECILQMQTTDQSTCCPPKSGCSGEGIKTSMAWANIRDCICPTRFSFLSAILPCSHSILTGCLYNSNAIVALTSFTRV